MSVHDHSHRREPSSQGNFLRSRAGLVLLGFLAIAGILMLTEHRAHVLGALFWLLPFACLFMHMFMHGGRHGAHDRRNERNVS
jgi:Protein of unknown function (DUF2933)